MSYELNNCHVCGARLAPDDFDGVCAGCDSEYEIEPEESDESASPGRARNQETRGE